MWDKNKPNEINGRLGLEEKTNKLQDIVKEKFLKPYTQRNEN